MITTLLATGAGFITGALTTTLASNQSGKERRQQIKQNIEELTADINDVTQSLQRVKQSLNHLAVTAQTIIPETKESIDELTRQATFQLTPRIENIEQSCSQLQHDLTQNKPECVED